MSRAILASQEVTSWCSNEDTYRVCRQDAVVADRPCQCSHLSQTAWMPGYSRCQDDFGSRFIYTSTWHCGCRLATRCHVFPERLRLWWQRLRDRLWNLWFCTQLSRPNTCTWCYHETLRHNAHKTLPAYITHSKPQVSGNWSYDVNWKSSAPWIHHCEPENVWCPGQFAGPCKSCWLTLLSASSCSRLHEESNDLLPDICAATRLSGSTSPPLWCTPDPSHNCSNKSAIFEHDHQY